MPLHHTRYPAEFGRSTSSGTGVIKEIRVKIWFLASCLSRSSEPTQIDPLPMISY